MNGKSLQKREFVMQYSKKYHLTYLKSKEIVESVLDLMQENFKNNNSLIFRRFGSFEIRECKKKQGINPKTKEIINLKPRKYVKFKMSDKTFEIK